MNQKKSFSTKKPFSKQTNTAETLNHFFGFFPSESQSEQPQKQEKPVEKSTLTPKGESVFNYQSYYEKELVKRQIKELVAQIKKEIELIKKAEKSVNAEIKDIEKITVESLPTKPGIYHIRFLEIILRILKTLREKISDSGTWLSAMVSRKKKRGSLFLALSKKKGTQYSLSQELASSRSIQ